MAIRFARLVRDVQLPRPRQVLPYRYVRSRAVSGRSLIRLLPIVLAIALGSLVDSANAAGTGAGRTYVTSDCNGAAFKPREVILTCGDAGLVATKMQWKHWGAARANGVGTGREKVCVPNCAAGRVATGKMQLSLFRPRLCPQDGKRHFTRVHYSWPNGAPGEGPKQGTIPLPCSIL